MASKTHRVQQYTYAFDARAGGASRIQLWGERRKLVEVGFVDDGSPVPAPVVSADLTSATAFLTRSVLPGLIDMLRATDSLGVLLDDEGTVRIVKRAVRP